ncbi:hypothetical protein [Streptomyces sp. SID5910]|uniref:hypothetical protein n=1 Tax=Streptomyces sp. SID5910 TaxID=2690312 RepID=UPI00136ECB69|nr:hypothetical protein [Streptomyces sp. SID5910]MYR44134.1 hypothetical protein [Streptomyces sp. SID5910]
MTEFIGRPVTRVSLLLGPRGVRRHTGARPTVLDGSEAVAVRPYVLAYTSYDLEAAA